MGCCFSKDEDGGDGNDASEMEMKNTNENDPMLSISSEMTAPTIQIEDNNTISGHGLALACVNIEQDAAYWEVHVMSNTDKSTSNNNIDIYVGLATKKKSTFYNDISYDDLLSMTNKNLDDEMKKKYGLEYMSKVSCQDDGDCVVGIIIQQSDLPMIQFTKNGTILYDASITRFRGTVHPSFFIMPSSSSSTKMKVVFAERLFRHPHPSCSPVIVARGLV